MRWCEQYPSRERRELWVTAAEGQDIKLIVHSRLMPVRRGHLILGVLHGGQLIGLRNLTTGEQVNFVRSDPPLLFRRCDGVGLALFVAASLMAGGGTGWPLVDAVATLLALLHARWIRRRLLAGDVEGAIDAAQRQAVAHHGLRRV
jgi:hypothetical protein